MIAVLSSVLRRWRRRGAGERGLSVIELMTALTLMLIVGTAVGSTLVSSTRATASIEDDSRVVDAIRVAMAQVEREFRSAECVREPVPADSETTATASKVRFTTHSNGGSYEVTYAVIEGDLVRTRGGVDQVLVEDVLVEPDETFTYAETPRRRITVRAVVELGDDRRELSTTVSGRNAWRNC